MPHPRFFALENVKVHEHVGAELERQGKLRHAFAGRPQHDVADFPALQKLNRALERNVLEKRVVDVPRDEALLFGADFFLFRLRLWLFAVQGRERVEPLVLPRQTLPPARFFKGQHASLTGKVHLVLLQI